MFLHLQNITYHRDVSDIGDRFSHADPRYDIFFKQAGFDLLTAGRLRILSWNYDHQIELSDINDARYKTILPLSVGDNSEDEDRIFFKLNGALVLENKDRSTLENDAIYRIEELLQSKYCGIKNGLPHISFSFEDEKNLEKVLPKVRDTQVLVAIGYSFPEDNFVTDKAILEGMHKLKEIYVQLPYDVCSTVIDRLRSDYLVGNDVNCISITDVNEFHIPSQV